MCDDSAGKLKWNFTLATTAWVIPVKAWGCTKNVTSGVFVPKAILLKMAPPVRSKLRRTTTTAKNFV